MAYGILIILFFINIAVGIIVYAAIRLLLARQQALLQRITLLEEFVLELAPENEPDQDFAAASMELPTDVEGEVAASAMKDEKVNVSDKDPDGDSSTLMPSEIAYLENERVQSIVRLAAMGLTPEIIARQTGFSEGEVRLALSLHRGNAFIRSS